jgi:hypothetical protein
MQITTCNKDDKTQHNTQHNIEDNIEHSIEMNLIYAHKFINICCICLEEILDQSKDSYFTTDCCLQSIHKRCFIEWVFSKTNKECVCPMCRKQVDDLNKIDIGITISVLNDIVKINDIDKKYIKNRLQSYYTQPILEYLYTDDNTENNESNLYNISTVCYNMLVYLFFLSCFLIILYMILTTILSKN